MLLAPWLALPLAFAPAETPDPVPLGPLSADIMSLDVAPDGALFVTVRGKRFLYRSDDGGQTFTEVGELMPFDSEASNLESPGVVLDPLDADHLVGFRRVGSSDALVSSTDGGATWNQNAVVSALVLGLEAAENGAYFLAHTGLDVLRSSNGQGWSSELTVTNPSRIHDTAIAPGNSNVAYAATDAGLYRSNTGGLNWSLTEGSTEATSYVLVHPEDPQRIWNAKLAAGLGFSVDGGSSYTLYAYALPPGPIVSMAYDPSDASHRTVWVAIEGEGIWKTSDHGTTWTEKMNGLPQPVVHPRRFAFEADGSVLLASGVGLFRLERSASAWQPTGFAKSMIRDVAIGAGGKRIAAMTYQVAAGDAGGTLEPTSLAEPVNLQRVTVDPADPTRWLASGNGLGFEYAFHRVWEITDDGQSHRLLFQAGGLTEARGLEVDPFDAQHWVLVSRGVGAQIQPMAQSFDGAETWSAVDASFSGNLEDLSFDPHEPGRYGVVTDTGTFYWTADNGQSFSQTSLGGNLYLFAFDRLEVGTLYRGDTATGLSRARDWDGVSTPTNWEALGIPTGVHADIEFSPIAPGHFWVSSGSEVLVTGDGGDTFDSVFDFGEDAQATRLALDPASRALIVGGLTDAVWELPEATPYSVFGAGVAGAGAFVPRHYAAGDLPRLGSTDWQLHATDVVGGAPGVLLVSLTEAAIPFLGGELLVEPPYKAILGGVADGAPGVAGAGTIVFPTPIPDLPALVGLELASQVLVADAAAPFEVALSNGWKSVLTNL